MYEHQFSFPLVLFLGKPVCPLPKGQLPSLYNVTPVCTECAHSGRHQALKKRRSSDASREGDLLVPVRLLRSVLKRRKERLSVSKSSVPSPNTRNSSAKFAT
jgi:hypothetical protein